MSSVDEGSLEDSTKTDIRFCDVQDIQLLQDKALRLFQFLCVNRTVLVSIQKEQSLSCSLTDHDYLVPNDFVSSLIIETNVQLQRAQTMLDRLAGTLALVLLFLRFSIETSQLIERRSKVYWTFAP